MKDSFKAVLRYCSQMGLDRKHDACSYDVTSMQVQKSIDAFSERNATLNNNWGC